MVGQVGPEGNSAAVTEVAVFVQSRTLTDEEIKALPSTAIAIVPAQGAGTVIQPLSAGYILNTSAGAYVASADASWTLVWIPAAGQSRYASTTQPIQSPLQSATESYGGWATPSIGVINGGNFDGLIQNDQGSNPLAEYANLPLGIKDDYMGVADYTGGNAANSLKVIVLYTVIDV